MVDYTASGLEKMRKAYIKRKGFLYDLKKKKNKVVVLLTNSMFYILIRPKR